MKHSCSSTRPTLLSSLFLGKYYISSRSRDLAEHQQTLNTTFKSPSPHSPPTAPSHLPPAQPHQLLGPQADEDALGVLTVVPTLHKSQEQLGGIVLREGGDRPQSEDPTTCPTTSSAEQSIKASPSPLLPRAY